jgi:formylglycine-generating enzyme required for sulfatase activity
MHHPERTVGRLAVALIATLVPLACGSPTAPPGEIATSAAPTPTATPVPTRTRAADGMVMVYVPAGEFTMGSTDEEADAALALCGEYRSNCERHWFEHELPAHTVALDGFWIDRTEVTNEQYALCVADRACKPPRQTGSDTRESYYGDSSYDDYPVIYVDWYRADAYCEWAGARLPTEAQWEYAARGPEGHIFPWGDELDGTRLNYCDASCEDDWADESFDDGYPDTAPVGSYLDGASWVGALDLAGNVWEWTANWYEEYPSGRQENPTGPASGEYRVVRGGGWISSWSGVRSAYRNHDRPGVRYFFLGFRCAASPGE